VLSTSSSRIVFSPGTIHVFKLAAVNFFYKTCNNPVFSFEKILKEKPVLKKAQPKQYKWKHEFSQSLWLFPSN
jgi:hypothetical protein